MFIYLKRFGDLCSKTNGAYKRAKVFRQLQLLNGSLNGIQKGPPILAFIFTFIVIEAFALSTLIGSNTIDLRMKATLFIVTVDCFMGLLIIVGQMGMVNQKSSSLIETMKNSHKHLEMSVGDRKWEHRFYRSCSALKILIGSTNFVDELTPLNCLNFSIDCTVNLLLLSGNNS